MAQIGETELDVRALWRALWRRSWLLVLLTIAVAAATYVGLGFVDPLYTADTSILIEQRESPLTRPREDRRRAVGRLRRIGDPEPGRGGEVARDRRCGHRQARPHAPAGIRSGAPAFADALDPRPAGSRREPRRFDDPPARDGQLFQPPHGLSAAAVAGDRRRVLRAQSDARRRGRQRGRRCLRRAAAGCQARLRASPRPTGCSRRSSACADAWPRRSRRSPTIVRSSGLFDVNRIGADTGDLSTQQLGDINAELARARAARAEAEARAAARRNAARGGRRARRLGGGAEFATDPAAARAAGRAPRADRRALDHAPSDASAHPRAAMARSRTSRTRSARRPARFSNRSRLRLASPQRARNRW